MTDRIVLVIIGVFTVVFGALACLQFHNFSTETNEITYFSYALSHTDATHLLPLYFMKGSLLGAHPNILFLLLLPIYKVMPSVEMLLILQSLLLSASAWPLYLLLRRKINDGVAALFFTVAYLSFPPVISQYLNQIHDDQFANLWLILAAYYFVDGRFWRFLIPLALVCLTKEYFSLTAAMFGLWALLEHRSWKWVVTPVAVGISYFVFASKFFIPWVGGLSAKRYSTLEYLDVYGKSPGEIMKTMLTNPSLVFQTTFSPQKLQYLLKLLGPVCLLLPFLSAAAVLCLPNLAMNLVGTNSAFLVMPWHYGVFLGSALFIAVACSLTTLTRLTGRLFGKPVNLRILGAVVIGLNLVGTTMWLDTSRFKPVPQQAILRKVLENIPKTAAVLCPSPMLAHFSHHRAVISAYSLLVIDKKPEQLIDYDYIVLDGNWRNYEAIGQVQLVKLFNEDPQWQQRFRTVLQENNVYVLEQVK
ncbi:MAG: DUF2079 domain-containing protein [Verrucomicrobiota bacterium]